MVAGPSSQGLVAVPVNRRRTTPFRRPPPIPSGPPYPFAGAAVTAADGDAGSGDGGGGDHRVGGDSLGSLLGVVRRHRRCRCPRLTLRAKVGVNGREEIAVLQPVVGPSTDANPAACVTSTCGGGTGGRRWNDVDVGTAIGLFRFLYVLFIPVRPVNAELRTDVRLQSGRSTE